LKALNKRKLFLTFLTTLTLVACQFFGRFANSVNCALKQCPAIKFYFLTSQPLKMAMFLAKVQYFFSQLHFFSPEIFRIKCPTLKKKQSNNSGTSSSIKAATSFIF